MLILAVVKHVSDRTTGSQTDDIAAGNGRNLMDFGTGDVFVAGL